MTRDEYQQRQREMSARGEDLPWSKLTADKVREAREMHERAQFARAHIDEHYSVAALAKRYGVHTRTMEKVVAYESWGHVK